MRKTVVCQLALGMTRVSGYTLYDHESMAFEETTPRDVKALIRQGIVNGLVLDKENNIQLDEAGFNCKNLLVKSGVGNYRPMKPCSGLASKGTYALTKVADTDDGMVYEVVSHMCARIPVTEQKIRALYQLGCLYGCWIDENTNMIEFAKGVEMVDMTSEAIQERLEAEKKEREEQSHGCNDVTPGTVAERDERDDGHADTDHDSGFAGHDNDGEADAEVGAVRPDGEGDPLTEEVSTENQETEEQPCEQKAEEQAEQPEQPEQPEQEVEEVSTSIMTAIVPEDVFEKLEAAASEVTTVGSDIEPQEQEQNQVDQVDHNQDKEVPEKKLKNSKKGKSKKSTNA
mgnify:CR=1 FL=1